MGGGRRWAVDCHGGPKVDIVVNGENPYPRQKPMVGTVAPRGPAVSVILFLFRLESPQMQTPNSRTGNLFGDSAPWNQPTPVVSPRTR